MTWFNDMQVFVWCLGSAIYVVIFADANPQTKESKKVVIKTCNLRFQNEEALYEKFILKKLAMFGFSRFRKPDTNNTE